MEILMLVVLGALMFLGLRTFLRGRAQRMHSRLQSDVTPEAARIAVLALNDEQHKEVYKAIAAEDGKRALVAFKQATGASMEDCVVAIQALHRYPQNAPSQIRFSEDFDLADDAGREGRPADEVEEDLLEDQIDAVRDDLDVEKLDSEGPLAEADPNTGEILGDNAQEVPDIPGGEKPAPENDEDLDERARELMRASGFDPDQELTIPEEWAAEDDEPAGFHLEVERGEEKISLSHEDLEPWVHDQLYALLRDDHVDEASQLLADHSPLTREEAHRFLVVFKNQS